MGLRIANPERKRQLDSIAFGQNQTRSIKLPTDTALKRLNLRLSGSFQVTYASGSPVFDVYGIFAKLVPLVRVMLDDGTTVKACSPFDFQQLQYFLTTQLGEQRYSTSASAFTTRIALTDGRPGAYPATTQYVLDNEQISLMFENQWAYGANPAGGGWSDMSILNLQRYTNPILEVQFASFGAMQNPASASVAVTYAEDQALRLDVTTVEASDIPASQQPLMFREYASEVTYSAQQTGVVERLNTGAWLQGVLFIVRDGGTTKALSNSALTRIMLRLNGQTIVQDTKFLDLQAENKTRRGITAPTSSSVSRIDGCAFMSCIKNGDVRTALDLRLDSGVREAQLLFDTGPSTGTDAVTYTNSVTIRYIVQELVGVERLIAKAS